MPYVRVHIDPDDILDELDPADLIDRLKDLGYIVTKKVQQTGARESTEGQAFIEIESLDHVEHLIDVGLYREARAEALLLIEAQLNRPNTISTVH